MKLKSYFIFFLSFLSLATFSQGNIFPCGYDELQSQIHAEDAAMLDKQDEFETQYLYYVNEQKTSSSIVNSTLPVVVHIVHLPGTPIGEEENITNEEVQIGLDRLNNTFAGNACGSNPMGNDMEIKFELAKRDINGQATNGIIRHSSNLSVFGLGGFSFMIFNAVGFQSPFPTTDYINIYLVKSICYTMVDGECSGPLGLATSSPSHGAVSDGLAIEAGIWINENECMSGKLSAHEMGHYFNLLHTFENGCSNDNCLTQGDKVCDTAPDNSRNRNNGSCINGITTNSCSTDTDDNYCNPFTVDENDPEDNIMDYSAFACQYLFTQGQKVRMHATLQNARESLFRTEGLSAPCSEVITTQFQGRIDVLQGSIEIYQSNPQNIDSIAWLVDSVFVSNNETLSYAFPEIGQHIITLQTFNNSGCKTEAHHLIKVYQTNCNLTAELDEIPPLCNDIFGNGFIRLNAIPSGGQWSDHNGVYINGAIRNEFFIGGLQPGTYPLYYTLRDGWCQQTFETEYTITDDFLNVSYAGGIDCNITAPSPITMSIDAQGQGIWRDNQNNEEDFDQFSEVEISRAGTYQFEMFTPSGECQLNFEVPSFNNASVQIEDCDDCQPYVNLCINGAPNNATINWFGGYQLTPGRWEAMVIDNNTGCESWAKVETTSLENKMPTGSAGSSASIFCGETHTLLGVLNSNEGDIDYWWTTTDGNIISGATTLTPTVDRPGHYELHVRNSLYGCENSDMTTVTAIQKNTSVQQTICNGESYEGYTESGIYLDTLNYACDCDSIVSLELTVLPKIEITSETTHIQNNDSLGSIEILSIEGSAPFTFSWSTGETVQSIQELVSDNYSLTITDANGCESNFDFLVDLTNGIKSFNEEVDIAVYPNPIGKNREATITINSNLMGKYKLNIYNMIGTSVQNFDHYHSSNITETSFRLPNSGLYIISIEYEKGGRELLKLMVSD